MFEFVKSLPRNILELVKIILEELLCRDQTHEHLITHARVQRIRGDATSHHLSLSDAMVPLIEPLSAKNLVGEASTSGVPTTATTTALSTTFTQTSFVPPILVVYYEVLGAELPTVVLSPIKILFEKEELETMLEHATAN
nr:hypothetical protein [Tanacetum cinerariifolium]